MTFMNEYISESDVKLYGLDAVDTKYVVGGTGSRNWTIDRERQIYLRCVARGREDIAHRSTWTFYWRGTLIELRLEVVRTTGAVGQACWAHKRVQWMGIPDHLRDRREQVINDLREALLAYKDGGVFSSCTSYSLTLDV